MRGVFVDYTGRRFGMLTVQQRGPNAAGYRVRWLCRCECGRVVLIGAAPLSRGQKSCGCATARIVGDASTTHGHWKNGRATPTYASWQAMKDRCTRPAHHAFAQYGGRGIKVCSRWSESFDAFLADMGERPAGRTLDRFPDKNGDYEPGNCRWATPSEQGRNTRANRQLTIGGETKTVTEWAERAGIGVSALRERLRRGWPAERAVSAPLVPQAESRWGPRSNRAHGDVR